MYSIFAPQTVAMHCTVQSSVLAGLLNLPAKDTAIKATREEIAETAGLPITPGHSIDHASVALK